jgi:hypothetical protein
VISVSSLFLLKCQALRASCNLILYNLVYNQKEKKEKFGHRIIFCHCLPSYFSVKVVNFGGNKWYTLKI